MDKQCINIVWFKRDLRLRDHYPLVRAVEEGLPTLLLYCYEPSLMALPESDDRHWRFARESVEDLRDLLSRKQLPLYSLHRESLPILKILREKFQIVRIFSHQETGLKHTFDRDRQIKAFCRESGIIWEEYRQDGVFRGLKDRRDWEARWEADMRQPLAHPQLDRLKPLRLSAELEDQLTGPSLPESITTYQSGFQPGGPSHAHRYFEGFLQKRAENYSFHLSKPGPSRRSCSRISPYIAMGNISVREVYQRGRRRQQNPELFQHLDHFFSRLWWRSHYMQKLESEWQIEFQALNPALRNIDRGYDPKLFNAWAEGRTGIPMVDASMRCLQATGWINFRMRAMLATFITFTLWQDWKRAATHLARLFTDFEPGIHFGQFQMQGGLTGYHPLRVFNPIHQSRQHDADGDFVRQWAPELKHVPAPQIYTTWQMPELEQHFCNCVIGKDYPAPIVNYDKATRQAKDRYWAFRNRPEVRAELPRIWERHCLPKNVEAYRAEEVNTGK